MATIQTENWLDNDHLHGEHTGELQNYVTNVLDAWTLTNTLSRNAQGSGSDTHGYYGWRGGIPISNGSGWFGVAEGHSVRPPQHITWTANSGQHVHLAPVVRGVRLYHDSEALTPSPTGVVGLEMYHWASSISPNFAFPNFNDASYEVDVYIYPKNDDGRFCRITNFPINTTGFGSTIVFNTTGGTNSQLRRGSIGTGYTWDIGITHNASPSQVSFVGWSLGQMFNYSGELVIAYRIHSAVTPYVISNNVPFNQNLLNAGIYGVSEPNDTPIEITGQTIHLGGSVVVTHNQATNDYSIHPTGGITLSSLPSNIQFNKNVTLRTPLQRIQLPAGDLRLPVGHSVAITGESITLQDGGLHIAGRSDIRVLGASVNLQDYLVYEINGVQYRDTNSGPGVGGGDGFIPVITTRLWRMLGLR